MNAQNLLYIITQAPYSNATGSEALDAVLSATTMEQSVSVLFMHDGVFQLKSKQDTSDHAFKEFTKTYKALYDLDVKQLFVLSDSLTARGLSADQLLTSVTLLSAEQVRALIKEQFRVMTF